jgi:hypothetical protein
MHCLWGLQQKVLDFFLKGGPHYQKDISSWGFDYGVKAGLKLTDTRALNVKCYNPEYTFVEKLQAVSTKFRQHQETDTMARNFLRHYYDLYQLLELKEVPRLYWHE